MLALVVLWTAIPALACFMPMPSHSCCRGMMQMCDTAASSAKDSCCQMHSQDNSAPPGRGVAFDHPRILASLAISEFNRAVTQPRDARVSGFGIPPPFLSLGASSILRI